MEIDETIVELAQKLDAWCGGFFATLGSNDQTSQGDALLDGVTILKELDGLKAKGLAAIAALLNHQHRMTENERAASLVQGLELAAKLEATLYDELLDIDGANKIVDLMNEIEIGRAHV